VRFVLRPELRGELHQLPARQRCQLRCERRVELLPRRHRLRVGRVSERREHDDVKELAQHLQRRLVLDRFAFVRGGISDPADQVELLRDAVADLRLEGCVADPSCQIVLVWRRQLRHVVEVPDQLLDRPTTVEARRCRVA